MDIEMTDTSGLCQNICTDIYTAQRSVKLMSSGSIVCEESIRVILCYLMWKAKSKFDKKQSSEYAM